jgi:hypothetical protein
VKLRYLLLFALALTIPAGFVHANPVDPSVIINKTSSDATTFSMNSVNDPLVIMLNSQGLASLQSFEYIGTAPLTKLFVELDGTLPLEQFDCVSNIFTECGSFSTGVGDEVGLIFEDGTLSQNEMFTVEVATPEPGTMVLLLTGALPLIGFGRRRWSAMRNA